MASSVDSRQALTAMCSVLTAYTSATGISTATFATSISNKISLDTTLSAAEKAILSQLSTGLGVAQPSSAIHNSVLGGGIEMKQMFGAIVSALTAWSSASSVSTTTYATYLSCTISNDTGLTSTESTLATLLTSALASATPSNNAHNQV